MNYVFSFMFSFDDPNDEDGYAVEAGFLVGGQALEKLFPDLAQINPKTVDDSASYRDWYSTVLGYLEDKYQAVHDVSGTYDETTFVEGICTYEIETHEEARKLVEEWREQFAQRVDGAPGLGPVCFVDCRKLGREIVEAHEYIQVFGRLSGGFGQQTD